MTQTIGSRRQVWNGTAKRTSGGLTKSDLIMSHGRIVSRSKHFSAKKEMRLLKYGYGTQKGKFGYVKINKGKKGSKSRKMRGGMSSLAPSGIDSNEIGGTIVGDYGKEGSLISDSMMLSGGASHQSVGMAGGRRKKRGKSMKRSMGRGRTMKRNRSYGMAGGEDPDKDNFSGGITI